MWHIKTFTIQHFKSFREAVFHFNPSVNILTGVNNAGKTTVLEALALWNECIEKTIQQAQKTSKSRKAGQWYFEEKHYNHKEINSIRSPFFEDLFYQHNTESPIRLSALLAEGDKRFSLTMQLKPASLGNYLIEHDLDHDIANGFDLEAFNDTFALPHFMQLVYTQAIAAVPEREDYMYLPKIREQIKTRNSLGVIRNRINRLLRGDYSKFEDFQQKLNQILYDISSSISGQGLKFSIQSQEGNDIQILVAYTQNGGQLWQDISLLGSGTLQIIELLLAFYEAPHSLNIVLLDEPDSHLHRALQKRMLDAISQFQGTQIFMTTHNEGLIRSASPSDVFLLEPKPTAVYHSLIESTLDLPKMGVLPFYTSKALKVLDGNSSLDFVNALECKRVMLIEGKSDAGFIEHLMKFSSTHRSHAYWSMGSVENIYEHIGGYKTVFSQIRNGGNLWEKTMLIFDRDLLTDDLRTEALNFLKKELHIPVFIWQSYTIEAVMFSDIALLASLLSEYSRLNTAEHIQTSLLRHLEETIKDVKLRNADPSQEKNKKLKKHLEQLNALGKGFDLKKDTNLALYLQSAYQPPSVHKLMDKGDVQKVLDAVSQDLGWPVAPTAEQIWGYMTQSRMFEDCKQLLQLLR